MTNTQQKMPVAIPFQRVAGKLQFRTADSCELPQTAKWDKEHFAFKLLSRVPLELWQALSRISLVLPYYHIVTDDTVPHVQHLYGFRGVKQFREDLEFFLSRYSPVGLLDVIRHVEGKTSLPRRCFMLSFDDGFREMHDIVAPILKEKGVPATFFLNSGFIDNADMAYQNKLSVLVDHYLKNPKTANIEAIATLLENASVLDSELVSQILAIPYGKKHLVPEIAQLVGCDISAYMSSSRPYLTKDEVNSLIRQGFTIGAHSVDHPLYSEISIDEQIFQTEQSLKFITETFGIPYRAFAFPHSDTGVGREFFQRLYSEKDTDISFGTGGLTKHFCPKNLERFTMEKTVLPARRILGRHYPRGIYRNILYPSRDWW